jgi:4-hydroxy-tetrahydrodipicolinate reductase
MTSPKILVAGVGGRMGRAVVCEIAAAPSAALAGGFERADSDQIGDDIGILAGLGALGLKVESSAAAGLPRANVMVDFTTAAASLENAGAAAAAGVACVIGATGFSDREDQAITGLSKKIAILKSGNMSLGVNLLAALIEQAARRLPDDYDIEIIEKHHRLKVDAPSGAALMLGQAAADGRGIDLGGRSVRVRDGMVGERRAGDIGFAVVRGGGIIGEHQVLFAGSQEVLTFSHAAIDRGLFARGAVAAAIWVADKPPGLYSMRDVLDLK